MISQKERRRKQRIDIALSLKITYNKESVLATSKNISLLGAYVYTDEKIPNGTDLNVIVKLPQKQISCQAVAFGSKQLDSLKNKYPYGTGVFFRSFTEQNEIILEKYIDYLLQKEKEAGKLFMHKQKEKLLKRKGGGKSNDS